MKQVFLYENKAAYAKFMAGHLRNSMEVSIEQEVLDPLKLYIGRDRGERSTIHLHNAYDDYRYHGDLNAVVHYLNMLTMARRYAEAHQQAPALRIDQLIPVLRTDAYIEEFRRTEIEPMHFDGYPGLHTVLSESHDGYSAVVCPEMLEHNPGWTPDKLFRKAVSNLRKKGWKRPTSLIQ